MTQDLTIYDNRHPELIIKDAKAQATSLMNIVESQHLYLQIGDKRHLYVEAWETIGAFNQSKAVPETIEDIIDIDGNILGYQARVVLYRHGIVDGAGIGECRLSEQICHKKNGDLIDNAHNACKSMAQTRATSKAYRTNYAWVAVLAGYAPTPAEEMIRSEAVTQVREHYCQEHKTAFFMRGKMRSYAHPVKGQKDWCVEHTPQAEAEASVQEAMTQIAEMTEEAKKESYGEVMARTLEEDDATF